jgi:leader peptidase (prepilin peptidase) / N-methyltransferase
MDPLLLEYFLSPWVVGLFGLAVGSFLNVVIHRLPLMMEQAWTQEAAQLVGAPTPEVAELSLAKPASRCPACGHLIAWHENIPVLSYLRLGGKCAACNTPISLRYPVVEILTGTLFALVAWRLGPQPVVLIWCGFMATLVALSGIDWDTTLLPDNMTLPLLWAGLIAAALGWTIPLPQAVWGAVAGYLSLWLIYWLFKLITGKEGMGYGDFKLLAALGAWLGIKMLLPIVLAASVIGAVVGIAMKFTGELREGRYVPFGPFLAGAGMAVMLAGQARVMAWLGWA